MFRTGEDEKVVSVTWLDADADADDEIDEETGSEVLGDNVADTDDTAENDVSEPETTDSDE